MRRRGLIVVAALLAGGCSTAQLGEAVPLHAARAVGSAAPTTTEAPSSTLPPLTQPRPTPTSAAPTAGGSSTPVPTVPTATEANELVGDPGRDDADCSVPVRRSPDPTRPRYQATVVADPATGTVDGHLSVQASFDLPVDRVIFRLWANSPRIVAAGGHLEVDSPTASGLVAPLERPVPTTAAIVLPALLPAGQAVTVGLDYHLTIPGPSGDRVSLDDGALRLGSFLPLLPWEPGQGWDLEPPTSGFAEAATSPAADWDVTVTAPADDVVLGSGVAEGGGRWSAVAARDVAFSIGHFAVAEVMAAAPQPVTVTVGVQDGVGEDPAAYAGRVAAALQTFAARFGAYPWRHFTMAVTGGLSGGIEFPGHVMAGPGTVGTTTTHEVAHQWFYALVGNDQSRNPVLDEGLASYAELSAQGTLGGAQNQAIPPAAMSKAGQPMSFWEDHLDTYYVGVYVQGAQGLAALGSTDQVDCALARYVADNAFGIATMAKLLAALSSVVPNAAGLLVPYGIG